MRFRVLVYYYSSACFCFFRGLPVEQPICEMIVSVREPLKNLVMRAIDRFVNVSRKILWKGLLQRTYPSPLRLQQTVG